MLSLGVARRCRTWLEEGVEEEVDEEEKRREGSVLSGRGKKKLLSFVLFPSFRFQGRKDFAKIKGQE